MKDKVNKDDICDRKNNYSDTESYLSELDRQEEEEIEEEFQENEYLENTVTVIYEKLKDYIDEKSLPIGEYLKYNSLKNFILTVL